MSKAMELVTYNAEKDAFFEGERQLTSPEVENLSSDAYANALKLQRWQEADALVNKNTEFNKQMREVPPVEQVVEQPVQVEQIEVVEAAVETPIVETPVTPTPEFVYEYQPVDDLNRPLGNKQVFKGTNEREVLDKVAKANQELIKLSRELKRKNRLGILDSEEIPENIQRFTSPGEGEEALTLEQRLEKVEEENAILRARAEAELFIRANPSYYVCQENFETLTGWMVKNDLPPVRENFEYAFNKLSEVGLLLTAPIVREEKTRPRQVPVTQAPVVPEISANTQQEAVQASRITETVQPQQQRAVRPASGLTKDVATIAGPLQSKVSSVDQIVYVSPSRIVIGKDGSRHVIKESVTFRGKEALDSMPSEEYARRFKDPAFRKAVDTFYDELEAKRQAQ